MAILLLVFLLNYFSQTNIKINSLITVLSFGLKPDSHKFFDPAVD